MKLIHKISAGLLAVSCLFMLSACHSKQQDQANQQSKIKREDNTLPTGNYFQEDDQRRAEDAQRTQALGNVTSQMNKNYKSIGSVKNRGNSITLTLSGSQMEQMIEADQQGNSQAEKFWKELTTGMTKTSKTLSNELKDNSLTFKITDPNNNVLYTANNGDVTTNKLK